MQSETITKKEINVVIEGPAEDVARLITWLEFHQHVISVSVPERDNDNAQNSNTDTQA